MEGNRTPWPTILIKHRNKKIQKPPESPPLYCCRRRGGIKNTEEEAARTCSKDYAEKRAALPRL